MNFTRYYESVNLNGLKAAINTCQESLRNISMSSSDIISFTNGGEWISEASEQVTSAMQRNDERVNKISKMISTYESALSIVNQVLDMQNYMKTTELTEEQLKSKAEDIQNLVNKVNQIMREI